MTTDLMRFADTIGMFCRLNMKVKRDLPIRASEMGVLIFISKQENNVTPLKISQFFKISKPSVTSMINTLLRQSYLEKLVSIEDHRSYTLQITQKGLKLVSLTEVEYYKSIEIMMDKMGDLDFNHFIDLLIKANEILEGVQE
jgi:DNA-binding MarR family transcriptional regulator